MHQHVNVAIQVLPSCSHKDSYEIVDAAIEVISKSGLKFRVCPFETVIEGEYNEVMEVVKAAIEACYRSGAEKVLTNLKIQTSADQAVTIEDKVGKYDAIGMTGL